MKRYQVVILSVLGVIAACVALSAGYALMSLMYSPRATPQPAQAQPVPTVAPTRTSWPTSTPRPTATPEPVSIRFEGDGKAIYNLSAPAGVFLAYSWHIGDSNFIIRLIDKSTGRQVQLVSNCVGDCEDERVITISQPGEYLLEITADAAWALVIDAAP